MQKRYWAKREEVDRLFDLVDKITRQARVQGMNIEALDVLPGWKRGVKRLDQIE